jgi:hypothetical protein
MVLFPNEAIACRDGGNMHSFFHDNATAHVGDIAVNAEIISDDGLWIEAKVSSVINGSPAAKVVRFPSGNNAACFQYPPVGSSGIIVGWIVATSNGVATLQPVWGPSRHEEEMKMSLDKIDREIRKAVDAALTKR